MKRVLNFVAMNFTKIAKLNSKLTVLAFHFRDQVLVKLFKITKKSALPALILNHLITNKAKDIHV